MRISYVTETYPPEVNGVAFSTARCVDYLRGRGHALELIRPRQRDETPRDDREEWRCLGVPIPMYPEMRMGLALTGTLARRFARTRPDLVHVATPGPLGYAAVSAARRLNLPVTIDFRTNFHAYSRYYGFGWLEPQVRAYLRGLSRRASRTFVPSRQMMVELSTDDFPRLELVGRGVDAQRFSPAHRDPQLRADWGVNSDEDRVLLYVGRLAAEKNVLLALRAHDAIRHQDPSCRMIVVGDGPLRDRLQAEFPAARFVGARHGADLARHYASADIFLFPSSSETFGNVTLEALASGLAVVAFDCAAAGDHIAHRRNGFTVAQGDLSGFVEAARWATRMSTPRFAEVRHAARDTALRLTWDEILGRFEHHLLSVSLGHATGTRPHVVPA